MPRTSQQWPQHQKCERRSFTLMGVKGDRSAQKREGKSQELLSRPPGHSNTGEISRPSLLPAWIFQQPPHWSPDVGLTPPPPSIPLAMGSSSVSDQLASQVILRRPAQACGMMPGLPQAVQTSPQDSYPLPCLPCGMPPPTSPSSVLFRLSTGMPGTTHAPPGLHICCCFFLCKFISSPSCSLILHHRELAWMPHSPIFSSDTSE